MQRKGIKLDADILINTRQRQHPQCKNLVSWDQFFLKAEADGDDWQKPDKRNNGNITERRQHREYHQDR